MNWKHLAVLLSVGNNAATSYTQMWFHISAAVLMGVSTPKTSATGTLWNDSHCISQSSYSFPRKMYFLFAQCFSIFQRCYSQQRNTHQILCHMAEKFTSSLKFTAQWRGVTLTSFMRFDGIAQYNQAQNSLFMTYLEEMAIKKSLLYVKRNGHGNTFKFENVYLPDIDVSIIKLHT